MIEISEEIERILIIETKRDNKNICIEVKDSGGGIPDDIIGKVFEPYFTTKHQTQGTGLGLHMTYKIITDNMNGTIEAKNEIYIYGDKEYQGAVFMVTLPSD